MANSYTFPGVYVEEISTLPPSVVQVSTAVPAFLGNTGIQPQPNVPQKISNMLDYVALFGPAPSKAYALIATVTPQSGYAFQDGAPQVNAADPAKYNLYYALKMYFSNGGGPCYVLSVGTYASPAAKTAYEAGLTAIDTLDEPTLLVLPDATSIVTTADDFGNYYALCGEVMDHCGAKKDRFAILDVPRKSDGSYDYDGFRGISSNNLSYGAAYAPYLNTAIAFEYDEKIVTLNYGNVFSADLNNVQTSPAPTLRVSYIGSQFKTPQVSVATADASIKTPPGFAIDGSGMLTIYIAAAGDKKGGQTVQAVLDAWAIWSKLNDPMGFSLSSLGSPSDALAVVAATGLATPGSVSLDRLKTTQTGVYNAAKLYLNSKPNIVLPPSAAMAGIYASVDSARGVWKAPANVAVANVIGPEKNISDDEQSAMNNDPKGKSINAIRSFYGRGTLVWGARTLDGNSNEWRYIPVRRLFITVEESIQKATAFAVFEPNDISTWLKVKAMIDSYLFGLWQQGALAGPTPRAAYYVNVGLGKTMTDDDILNGRMIVEVGIAAVRPAEFIVLRFSHKMQEA